MIRRLCAHLGLALLRFARPKRGGTWTCGECGAENEDGRARCMNGCGTTGPLAPARPESLADREGS